jgi:hypothetical protein
MKTMNNIFKLILTVIAVVTFFSCDIPLALGSKLDIEGPVVEITSPSHRNSVPPTFDLTGTANDKTGVDRMLITAKIDNKDFPRQWRYQNGSWQVSDNYGSSWSSFAGGVWEGSNTSVKWKVAVNMNVPGFTTIEGEYTFTVQAWDKADFTDDNSLKAVILILDLNPPKVDVSYPALYRGSQPFTDDGNVKDFNKLHLIPDTGTGSANPKEFEDPAYLGKFITQEFDLKWQIEDMNDVWSIDLRLYPYDYPIDGNPDTILNDTDYIYKYHENIPPVPANVNPDKYIKPNGTITIPDLAKTPVPGSYSGDLKNPISGKTTIKIVALSYDAAGWPNQEKTIGYFIYWPRANNPWIVFPDGMSPPVYSPAPGSAIATLENTAYTVYPGKDIKATAYQAYGVKRIEYTVYECGITGAVTGGAKGNLTNALTAIPNLSGEINSQVQSTILAWSFKVPSLTGYYVVKAKAFSFKDQPSKEYEMLFRINDITFPDFPTPVQPAASEPLYLAMGTNGTQFTITGTVSDATGIDTLCLVWINPRSKQAAANAQLTYFREKDYAGWKTADNLAPSNAANGASANDGTFDPDFPNKLWKLNPVFQRIDPDTNRRIYTFSKTINVSDLYIGTDPDTESKTKANQPLKSQMFLFRAENPVDKCTIITYAPQGDTVTPAIKIDNVVIRTSTTNTTQLAICYPNTYTVLPIFNAGNTINITGKWREDSVRAAANLNLTTFFKNFFEINVNNTVMNHMANQPALTVSRAVSADADGSWDGTWTLTAVVGPATGTTPAGNVPLNNLKDTLVIDARTKDIGGNVAQLGSSWLIKSDKLQLLRISSEKPDDIYGTGEQIEIFLEFSKPVQLNDRFNGNKQDIQLILSTASGNTARARYKDGQNDQNSRQYFVYTVASGENTTNPEYLNVTGLCYGNTVYTTSTAYTASDYPFTWQRGATSGSSQNSFEEVRLTMQTGKNGETQEGTAPSQYYVRTLPTSTTTGNADYQFTLFSAKHIKIDTTLPTITAISTTTPAGYYSAGDIYFTIKFSEDVKLGTGTQSAATPQFPLNMNGNTVWSSANAADVRVNKDTITFKYTIQSSDTSGGNQVYVSASTNMRGDIYDIAGNKLAAAGGSTGNNLSALTQAQRTLTGVYVETQAPTRPYVRVLSANVTATDTNVISQSVVVGAATTTNYGRSEADNRNLSNVYHQNLYLAVQSNTTGDNATTPYKCDYMEYSIDGTNWVKVPNNTNTPFILEKTGNYTITARQVDKAGNKSVSTPAVTFYWDPGSILTRISSTNANGEYTHVTGRNSIALTLNFRKALYFAGTPQITLNIRNDPNTTKTVTTTRPTTPVSSLTFNYTVADGDYTQTAPKTYLDVTDFSAGGNVYDGNNTGVIVTNLITLPSGTPKLDSTKEFTVVTGALAFTNGAAASEFPGEPAFIANNYGGTDNNVPTSSNYHGIRDDDGSYWTTLRMTYNHKISKNDGSITIRQIQGSGTGSYRLPTVMTEAQYNRFKNISVTVSGTVYNTDTFYIKGTNGYKYTSAADQGSDTTNKYILQYKYDPRRDVTGNNTGFNGNAYIPQAFIDAFRTAETISIPVNSQAVTITNNDNTLNIRLSGSNAPQVPGAIYEISLPAGLVTDSLGNNSAAFSKNVQLGGVAKPFVRIRKTQDTITTTTASGTQPRIVAAQPFLANARMDCRTPDSTITYTASTGQTSVTFGPTITGGTSTTTGNNNWVYNAAPYDNTANYPNPPAPDAARPTNATGTTYTISNQVTFGYTTGTTSPDINNVQGFQWWVRARASVGTTNSLETEEMAYRTVISFSIRNNNGAVAAATGRSIFEDGDQAWIRGGDSIGSSSIPGFPFTWEDNWDTLKNKRAGIRLMTMVPGGNNASSNDPITATKDNTNNNVYTAAVGSTLGTSNTWITIEVNGTRYSAWVVSNTNRTFRIRNAGTGVDGATTPDGGNTAGLALGANITFTVVPSAAGTPLNNSLWRFVTWDMNTTAYVDFIRGRDLTEGTFTASSADVAWQYGPKRWCYQVDGWTSFKDRYPVYAGKHRWCDMGTTMGQHGTMNFSGTFMGRPDKTVDYTGVNTQ